MLQCAVWSYNTIYKNKKCVSFYSFPRDRKHFKKWLGAWKKVLSHLKQLNLGKLFVLCNLQRSVLITICHLMVRTIFDIKCLLFLFSIFVQKGNVRSFIFWTSTRARCNTTQSMPILLYATAFSYKRYPYIYYSCSIFRFPPNDNLKTNYWCIKKHGRNRYSNREHLVMFTSCKGKWAGLARQLPTRIFIETKWYYFSISTLPLFFFRGRGAPLSKKEIGAYPL